MQGSSDSAASVNMSSVGSRSHTPWSELGMKAWRLYGLRLEWSASGIVTNTAGPEVELMRGHCSATEIAANASVDTKPPERTELAVKLEVL